MPDHHKDDFLLSLLDQLDAACRQRNPDEALRAMIRLMMVMGDFDIGGGRAGDVLHDYARDSHGWEIEDGR